MLESVPGDNQYSTMSRLKFLFKETKAEAWFLHTHTSLKLV